MIVKIEVPKLLAVTAIGQYLLDGHGPVKSKKQAVTIIKEYVLENGHTFGDDHYGDIEQNYLLQKAEEIYDKYFGLMLKG